MNTQTRYRTLVSHLAKVYAAEESARTVALHEGLDEIVAKLQPDGAGAWKQVKADSQRLLKVWMARETRPGDAELASQILDALDEFAMDAAIVSAVAAVVVTPPEPAPVAAAPVAEKKPSPASVTVAPVAEKKPAPVAAPVTVAEKPAPVAAPVTVAEKPAPVAAPVPVLIVEEKVSAPTSSVIQHVEDEEEEVEVEEEVEEEEEEEAATVEEEVEVEEEEVVEPEEEEAEEEETEEAEEETPAEEEGMEVEKKIFRGRAYWMDVHTNKLYAVIGDDDVGDEVGKVVEGRPVFLATTR